MMPTKKSDDGFTLVELLVAGMLLSLVVVIVAGIMVSITTTQRNVTATTTSTTQAQQAATGIATGLRNASEFSLTTPTGTDQLLVVRTASQGATLTWSCKAWYYSATSSNIRSTITADGTKITSPTSTQLATWSLQATGVTPRAGTAIFTAAGGGITISYNAAVANGQPVAIQTTVVKRTGVSEAGTCY